MYKIIVDYFTSDNTFQVMLYNKSVGDTVDDNIKQGLNFSEMIEEVSELKKRVSGGHVAEVIFNTFDADETLIHSSNR